MKKVAFGIFNKKLWAHRLAARCIALDVDYRGT